MGDPRAARGNGRKDEGTEEVVFFRHPPERGLQFALYGGTCCTTCCCCCCCCAHSVGGVIGAEIAHRAATHRSNVQRFPQGFTVRASYWKAVVVSSGAIMALSFGVGIILVVFALPVVQVFASLWTWMRLETALEPAQKPDARRLLAWMTVGSVFGSMLGGLLTWAWFTKAFG